MLTVVDLLALLPFMMWAESSQKFCTLGPSNRTYSAPRTAPRSSCSRCWPCFSLMARARCRLPAHEAPKHHGNCSRAPAGGLQPIVGFYGFEAVWKANEVTVSFARAEMRDDAKVSASQRRSIRIGQPPEHQNINDLWATFVKVSEDIGEITGQAATHGGRV
jgi:hypothetical protein